MSRVYWPTGNAMGVRTMTGILFGDDFSRFRAPAEARPRGANNPVNLGAIVASNGNGGSTSFYNDLRQRIPPTHLQPVAQSNGTPSAAAASTPPQISSAGSPIAPTAVPTAVPTSVVNVPPSAPTNAVLVSSGGGTPSPNVAPAAAAATYTTDASGDIISVQTGSMVMTAAQAASAGVSAQSLTNAAAGVAAPPAAAAAVSYTTDAAGDIVNAATGQIFMTAAQAASAGVSATALNAGTAAAGTAAPTDVTDQVAAWLGSSTTLFGYAVPNPVLAGVVILGFALLDSMGSKKK